MKNSDIEKMAVVFVSTFPPRECGIATFSSDLIKNCDQLFGQNVETKVVAMNTGILETYNYPKKVIFQISENKLSDYIFVARKLNEMPEVKAVSIQHEYGIFGANSGENILAFLAEIKKPTIVTFHTILPEPSMKMKEVTSEIASRASCLVVMTRRSKDILEKVYAANPEKIKIIPHGIHPLMYLESHAAKSVLRLGKKRILSTFGMLGADKGIEYAIASLPEIIKTFPDVVYLVIGATHPLVLRSQGEKYRNQLIAQSYKLGVENHVLFYNEYLKTNELLKFLQATDLYLSLSQNPDQAVSGTLTYALGAGRPVLSTPFAQAKEIITPEVGSFVDFKSHERIAKEVISLFLEPARLTQMSKNAYFRTRSMTWPNVALAYMRAFSELSPDLAKKQKNIPPIKLQHLAKLTNDFGIFQFAILTEPDPNWGYTLDDNARALVGVSEYYRTDADKTAKGLAEIYMRFLEQAKKSDGFVNYFTSDRHPHGMRNLEENLEDAEARTLWSLATAATSNLPEDLKKRATVILDESCEKFDNVSSPRAVAFHIKAMAIWCAIGAKEKITALVKRHADFLLDRWNDNASSDWQWFEQSLTYSNAILPEAMLLAYKVTGDDLYFRAGKSALDFLISQSFQGDVCAPVGQSGWFKKGEIKKHYDQQPEEVSALVLACRTMYDLCGDVFYKQKMIQAFDWFLGNNILNQVVYSQLSGGCYDGLGEKEINLNQGAESTISYLLARLAVDPRHLAE